MHANHLYRLKPQEPHFSLNGFCNNLDPERVIGFENWKIYCDRFEVKNPSGEIVPFTTGEFLLLRAFANSSGRVLSRDQLFNWTRGVNGKAFDRAIDIQIGRLRKKLGDDYHHPRFIKTIRDIGYIFLPKTSHENLN